MQSKSTTGILLDTHVWIWLFEGNTQLSRIMIDKLDQFAQQGQLFLPAIAIWELAVLVAKKRLSLSQPLKNWVQESLSKPGISLVPLSPNISIESTLLPGNFHGDPADRIIVATALVEKLALVTRDRNILQYAKHKHINIIKA